MYRLVIFDLDGVLVDACEWHKQSLNLALQKISNYSISDMEHYATYNGLPTKVKLKKLAELNLIKKQDIDEIEKLKQTYTIQIINKHAELRAEKIELMEFLKFNNLLIGCYTNSVRPTAELMLKKTGIYHYFDIIVTNNDVLNSKPNPEGYINIINKFNLQPQEVIIIEDSPKGIEAAEKTNAKVIKVSKPNEVTRSIFKGLL